MVKRFIIICLLALGLLISYHGLRPAYHWLRATGNPSIPVGDTLKTHYLIDQEYVVDTENGFATMGHLLVFNPGNQAADLKVTLYFEDQEPQSFTLKAEARRSTESNYATWPIKPQPNSVFALKVESSEPVICQNTIGWTNTNNDYSPKAVTKSPKGIRETAKSYMAINHLGKEWFVADGLVLNAPDQLWIKESEWLVILNPNPEPAQVKLLLYMGGATTQGNLTIPGNRMKRIFMDERVPANQHYGTRVISTLPVAAQWLRAVNWYDSPEVMANWSVPAVNQAPSSSN